MVKGRFDSSPQSKTKTKQMNTETKVLDAIVNVLESDAFITATEKLKVIKRIVEIHESEVRRKVYQEKNTIDELIFSLGLLSNPQSEDANNNSINI